MPITQNLPIISLPETPYDYANLNLRIILQLMKEATLSVLSMA